MILHVDLFFLLLEVVLAIATPSGKGARPREHQTRLLRVEEATSDINGGAQLHRDGWKIQRNESENSDMEISAPQGEATRLQEQVIRLRQVVQAQEKVAATQEDQLGYLRKQLGANRESEGRLMNEESALQKQRKDGEASDDDPFRLVTADGFMAHCKWRFGLNKWNSYAMYFLNEVQKGDFVCVQGDYPECGATNSLPVFFEKLFAQLKVGIRLLTLQSECPQPSPKLAGHLDDPRLLAWFTWNLGKLKHPKLIQLPIGLNSDAGFKMHDALQYFKDAPQQMKSQKRFDKVLIYSDIARQATYTLDYKPGEKVGLNLSVNGTVLEVSDGGQADKNGIQVGDQVFKVGNAAYSIDALRSLLEGGSNFTITFQVERGYDTNKLWNLSANWSFADRYDNPKNDEHVYAALQRYKFVACPRHGGEDSRRLWEGLYMGAIPIVVAPGEASNKLSLLYGNLPVIKLENWEELPIRIHAMNTMQPFNPFEMPELNLDFWLKKLQLVSTSLSG